MVKASLALGALMLSGAVLAAPESLSKVDTAGGEILLEVQSNGMATAKIVKVSTTCVLRVSAANKTQAEGRLKAEQDLMKGRFQSNLATATLDFAAPPTPVGRYEVIDVVEVAPAMAAAGDVAFVQEEDQGKPQVSLSKTVGISVKSASDMVLARTIMAESNCDEDYQNVRRPNIETADPSAAQFEAKAKAITAAKKQAEDYAAALGMRVVRIIRVSETGAIKEFLGPEADFVLQEMRGDRNRQKQVSNEMPVTASIAVDFVLGPK